MMKESKESAAESQAAPPGAAGLTQVTEALRRNEALTRAVMDSLAAHIAVLDGDGTIISTNAAWDRFARENDGHPGRTGTGVNYISVCRGACGEASEGADQVAEGISAVLLGTASNFYYEYPCHSPNERRWFLLQATGVQGGAGRAVLLHIDITERKLLEGKLLERERLKVLATGLINGQEEERRRLARELHDGLNQELALVAIELGVLVQKTEDPLREEIRALQLKTFDLSDRVRRISHQLHPASLEHLGLRSALQSFADEVSRVEGLAVEVASDSWPAAIPAGVKLCLYRVAQECVWNAVKHAQASRVKVSLIGSEDSVDMAVEDDGRGFDPAQVKTSSGLGLASMEERVNLVGGCFLVRSKPGAGTRIEVRVPNPAGSS